MESRRVESFSDGVFAVAITVLVFNLLPIADSTVRGYGDLFSHWPQYSAYVVSFLTIGIMWLNHHTVLTYVAKVDRVTLVLNTLLLMGVVAVPFPTALIAESLAPTRHVSARPVAVPYVSPEVAAVAYGLLLIAISVAFSGTWQYLAAHQDKLGARPMKIPLQATIRFSAGLAGYVVGTVVAIFSPDIALAIYAIIAVYYLFEHLPDPSAGSESEAAAAADHADVEAGESSSPAPGSSD
ncbi:MAG TPA: TMEM175 family protein [Streptosporangiaceae bacterium]|nr:TMEM175 family protein [Streptosporangiaceae bacterium]